MRATQRFGAVVNRSLDPSESVRNRATSSIADCVGDVARGLRAVVGR